MVLITAIVHCWNSFHPGRSRLVLRLRISMRSIVWRDKTTCFVPVRWIVFEYLLVSFFV